MKFVNLYWGALVYLIYVYIFFTVCALLHQWKKAQGKHQHEYACVVCMSCVAPSSLLRISLMPHSCRYQRPMVLRLSTPSCRPLPHHGVSNLLHPTMNLNHTENALYARRDHGATGVGDRTITTVVRTCGHAAMRTDMQQCLHQAFVYFDA